MVIGLTGGISSGKSVVLETFKNKNFYPIEADKVAKDLMNTTLFNDIKKNFNKCIIDNKIDYKLLGNIVFNDNNKRLLLNNLVHSEVKKELKNMITKIKKDVIIEVPLLYEAHYEDLFDFIIVVYLPKELQIERLMKRNNLSYDEAIKRIDSQMDLEKKKELADYCLINDRDIEYIKSQALGLIGFLRNEEKDGNFNHKRR